MKNKEIRVLFVCLGNICRSPAAEGAFLKLVKKENLESYFDIDSCGTSQYHIGSLPDPRTRQVAKQNGVYLTHKARQLRDSDLESFDFILAMDRKNLDDILSRIPTETDIAKVMLFAPFADYPKLEEAEVPDPYYGSFKDFEFVQDLVERSSIGFLKYLKENNKLDSISP